MHELCVANYLDGSNSCMKVALLHHRIALIRQWATRKHSEKYLKILCFRMKPSFIYFGWNDRQRIHGEIIKLRSFFGQIPK